MEEVNGKVAFVTGGASGIGLGMTRAFLKAGMQVAIGGLQSGGNRQHDVFAHHTV